jgi:hypothetical protein
MVSSVGGVDISSPKQKKKQNVVVMPLEDPLEVKDQNK